MNSLISTVGSDHLAFIVSAAQAVGCTDIAPSTIVYTRDPTTIYDGEEYVETYAEEVTITDEALVGHYKVEEIASSGGQIEKGDIMAIFLQSALSGEPSSGDIVTYSGNDYDYINHGVAMGLYCVQLRRP